MAFQVLTKDGVIVAAGYGEFTVGSGMQVWNLAGAMPTSIITDYYVNEETGTLHLRDVPLTIDETVPLAERRDRLRGRLGELLVKRMVLVELGKNLDDINARIAEVKAKLAAL